MTQKTIHVGDGTLFVAEYVKVWYQNDGQDVCFPISKRKAFHSIELNVQDAFMPIWYYVTVNFALQGKVNFLKKGYFCYC